MMIVTSNKLQITYEYVEWEQPAVLITNLSLIKVPAQFHVMSFFSP